MSERPPLPPTTHGTSDRITRDMIEGALAGLQAEINDRAPSMLARAVQVAAAVAAVTAGVAYLMGRRAGRRRSALVEVRRL